jgi:signal transduction histidine kinase
LSIGWKLTLWLTVPLVLVTVLMGWLYQQRSRDLLRVELIREGRAIARVVQIAAEDYLRDRQVGDLQDLAERITGYERVLGLRLFDADGRVTWQSSSLVEHPFRSEAELGLVLAGAESAEMRRSYGDQPALGFIVPLQNRRGERIGAVQILQLEAYMLEDDRAARGFILTLVLSMVGLTMLIVLVVTRLSISGPIEALVRNFREVGASDAPTRAAVRGDDELGRLAGEFNRMCERLEQARASLAREQDQRREIEARLRTSERLAGLGRLAAGLAHEIGTPLNVISGRAEALQRGARGDEAASKALRIIVSQTERIVRIVRDMLDFARMKPPRRIHLSVGPVVEAVVELIEDRASTQRVRVEHRTPEDLPRATADPDQLQQVFLNLAVNALDAMPDGGRLRIEAAALVASDPARGDEPLPCVAVAFEDTGSGIPADALRHVFDPFFTTKEAGRGTGLGLAVSYGIIQEHGGWFDLDSRPGHGTRITVHLPAARSADGGSARGAP